MIYQWRDVRTDKVVLVQRSMKDSSSLPTPEECKEAGLTKKEADTAQWVKVITGGSFSKGFGMKGHW